jgi:carboxyl-terminal processing protease
VGLALHITADRIGDPAQLIIRAVHPSGPAARAGITHGEEILTVNEEPVAGKTYQEAVRLIRGEVGSTVKLGLRGPQGERTVSLVRVSESVLMEQTPEVM